VLCPPPLSRRKPSPPTKPPAKAEGYDGLKVTNLSDEAGYGNYRPATHYGIFDPKNIRSRFAKFDPAKADSSDLLAYQPKVLERDATGRPIKREPFPRGAADRTVAEIEKRLPAGLLDLPTDEASRMARGYSGEANTTLAISRQMPDDQATKLIKSRIGQITRDAKLRGAPPSGPYAIEIGALRNRVPVYIRGNKELTALEWSKMNIRNPASPSSTPPRKTAPTFLPV
jgi:hypothetical protein